jgi:uncharacterized repeat protein (TIGR04042 family)
MRFAVRWPDGAESSHYSPSLVMHDYLSTGARYGVAEFVARAGEALDAAGERVRAAYGFACTSAMASRDEIVRTAAAYSDGEVVVLRMEPPLPVGAS